MKVLSARGEKIGRVKDVVLEPGGEVAYAVLVVGGTMGVGKKLFAIPWTVLHATDPDLTDAHGEPTLVLPLDKERMKSAPGFDKDHWPVRVASDWTRGLGSDDAMDRLPSAARPDDAGARTFAVMWKGSELKGFHIEASSGEVLGDITELAIDATGRVSYVVLSVGGFLGLGDTLVAVPWEALRFARRGDRKRITLAMTKDRLRQAPAFKSGRDGLAAVSDPTWISKVYDYCSVRPYWTRAGDTDKRAREPVGVPVASG